MWIRGFPFIEWLYYIASPQTNTRPIPNPETLYANRRRTHARGACQAPTPSSRDSTSRARLARQGETVLRYLNPRPTQRCPCTIPYLPRFGLPGWGRLSRGALHPPSRDREFCVDNLLVRIPYIIVMISGPASRHGSLNTLQALLCHDYTSPPASPVSFVPAYMPTYHCPRSQDGEMFHLKNGCGVVSRRGVN